MKLPQFAPSANREARWRVPFSGTFGACLIGILGLCFSDTVHAQTPPAPATSTAKATADSQNPKSTGLHIDLGYQSNLGKGTSSKGYYRLEYDGQQIAQRGVAPTVTTIGKPLQAPSLASPAGDSKGFLITVDNAGAKADNAIFNSLGLQKIPLNLLKEMRGAVQYLGRTDGGETHLSIGLETANFHPLEPLNHGGKGGIGLGLTNWLVLGYLQDAVSRSTVAGGNKNNGVAEYRSFIGRGFGWRRTKQYENALRDYVRANVPRERVEFDKAVAAARTKRSAGDSSPVDRVLLAVGDTEAVTVASAFKDISDANAVLNNSGSTAAEKNAANDTIKKANGKIDAAVDAAVKVAGLESSDQAVADYPTFDKGKQLVASLANSPDTAEGLKAVVGILAQRIQAEIQRGNAAPSDSAWQDRLRAAVRSYESLADQPSFALWAESSGWYTTSGIRDNPANRFNAIGAVTGTYWFKADNLDNFYLRGRYENGRERADPTNYRHFWSASLGYTF